MNVEEKTSAASLEVIGAEIPLRIKDVERAAKDWGVEPDHLEGRYVTALLSVMSSLNKLVIAAAVEVKAILRHAQEIADLEIVKLREHNRSAELAIRQAEVVQETIVTHVCRDLVRNLTDEAQQWLVVAQTDVNRRVARRFALMMTVIALALLFVSFGSGYMLRSWEDAPATQSLARCIKEPMRVLIAGRPQGDWVCKLDTVVPRSWRDLPDELKRRWLQLWPYGAE